MKNLRYIFCLLAITVCAAEPNKPRPTAEEVIQMWAPRLKSVRDFNLTGGSPKESTNVAAHTFRIVGATFGEVWNHYAQLCGMKERYEEKSFRIKGEAGPHGVYMVSDRQAADRRGGPGVSVFLLKTDAFTITATVHADPGGEIIMGSLTAVTTP